MPGLTATIVALAIALAIAAFANWQMRRPFDKRFLPVVPWLGVQFVAATVFLVMAAHLMSLLTGKGWGRHY
ncbi:MAG TPA: hypothetical protein VG742_01110 [Dongiaceae bacterium]|nr:hypothetical protein [Dongiaceae bacterium]